LPLTLASPPFNPAPPLPRYLHLGSLAYLGGQKGVYDLPVSGAPGDARRVTRRRAPMGRAAASWAAARHCAAAGSLSPPPSPTHTRPSLPRPSRSLPLPAPISFPPKVKLPFLNTIHGYLGAQTWRLLETFMQVGP
jgi:hypothetical protein